MLGEVIHACGTVVGVVYVGCGSDGRYGGVVLFQKATPRSICSGGFDWNDNVKLLLGRNLGTKRLLGGTRLARPCGSAPMQEEILPLEQSHCSSSWKGKSWVKTTTSNNSSVGQSKDGPQLPFNSYVKVRSMNEEGEAAGIIIVG